MTPLSEAEVERYSRQLILEGVGAAGQARLRAASALVVGAGALGSPVLLYLAAAGVGRITVADGDQVDLSNLSRQVLHGEADLGADKAASAAAAARRVNSLVEVTPLRRRLLPGDLPGLVPGFDLVCDASDNFETRFAVNDACVGAAVPLVHAAVLGWGGQVMTVVPGGPCYRCLFGSPPDAELVPTCAQAGILGPVAATLGSMQATEALKLLLGAGRPLSGRLLIYDSLEPRAREVAFSRDPACVAPHNPAPGPTGRARSEKS
jgi:molybdopterin/thiamine biosynthesis adenylyltransferase